MQLDFQQFLMKLEKLTDLRPIPDKEFVETYIKAYYLTENDMEQFIKNHRVRQMTQCWHVLKRTEKGSGFMKRVYICTISGIFLL